MEFLVFAAGLIALAVVAFIVVQGVRFYQSSVPQRDYRYLEAALETNKDEAGQLRAALEEIYATRYAGDDTKAHEKCVQVASKALNRARSER